MIRPGANVHAWVFDLDNTLYPASATVYRAVEARMTAYIARALQLAEDDAAGLRERYFQEYGATVAGLVERNGLDAHDFLEFVHDVDFDALSPDQGLNELIATLPGRKFVFTNGGATYARRVLERLGLASHFDGVCDIESAGLAPKPSPAAYRALIEHCAIDPARAVLIEDSARNLEPAHALGFTTALVGADATAGAYVDIAAADLKTLLTDWLVVEPAL